jgi:hypothetical protein
MDFRHLNIKGKILQPNSIKTSVAELTCFPDHRLSGTEAAKGTTQKTWDIFLTGVRTARSIYIYQQMLLGLFYK